MPKQKTIPELRAEIDASERQLAQLRTNSSSLKTAAATMRKATAGNGHTGLSPVELLLRAWLRLQRF